MARVRLIPSKVSPARLQEQDKAYRQAGPMNKADECGGRGRFSLVLGDAGLVDHGAPFGDVGFHARGHLVGRA